MSITGTKKTHVDVAIIFFFFNDSVFSEQHMNWVNHKSFIVFSAIDNNVFIQVVCWCVYILHCSYTPFNLLFYRICMCLCLCMAMISEFVKNERNVVSHICMLSGKCNAIESLKIESEQLNRWIAVEEMEILCTTFVVHGIWTSEHTKFTYIRLWDQLRARTIDSLVFSFTNKFWSLFCMIQTLSDKVTEMYVLWTVHMAICIGTHSLTLSSGSIIFETYVWRYCAKSTPFTWITWD